MATSLERIETAFNETFAHWGIRLPPENLRDRERGQINAGGWTIWFLFGADEDGEYLDYYAMHRMTNDRHVRLHADGRGTGLDALPATGYVVSSPGDEPGDAERRESEYWAECERVSRMLDEKGFSLTGDEHPINLLNRELLRSRENNRRLTGEDE